MRFRHYATCLAVLALGSPALAAAPDPDGQRVRMDAVTAQQAVDEFAGICLTGFPMIGRTHLAIRRSPFRYAAAAGATDEQWRSNRAIVGVDRAANNAVARCNFDAVLKTAVPPKELVRLVSARLAGMLRALPPARAEGTSVQWEWWTDRDHRVVTIDFSGTRRQFSASITNTPA